MEAAILGLETRNWKKKTSAYEGQVLITQLSEHRMINDLGREEMRYI